MTYEVVKNTLFFTQKDYASNFYEGFSFIEENKDYIKSVSTKCYYDKQEAFNEIENTILSCEVSDKFVKLEEIGLYDCFTDGSKELVFFISFNELFEN